MRYKYLWLNPVVKQAYDLAPLTKFLRHFGFKLIDSQVDQVKIVKDKYRKLLKSSDEVILDNRCPLMVDYFKKANYQVKVAPIEPILIHTARHLATLFPRRIKWISTPCKALKDYGNQLNLPNVVFICWDELASKLKLKLTPKKLDDSPIPLGFFSDVDKQVLKLTDDDLLSLNPESFQNYHLIEGLYCHNGCHNGDGVSCLCTQKKSKP